MRTATATIEGALLVLRVDDRTRPRLAQEVSHWMLNKIGGFSMNEAGCFVLLGETWNLLSFDEYEKALATFEKWANAKTPDLRA